MAGALQGWGSCDTDFPVGVMVAPSVCCTVPGLNGKNPANNCAAPLRDVLRMMPWTRPTTVWDTGMPFRSVDGKILPYTQMSSKQTSFNDIGVGPMGFAKSVSLNTLNLAFLLTPGMSRLPWLSRLDVGPSSEGLVLLVREALPYEKRHLAVYERLRMDPSRYAINPFDLPLGCEKPLKSRAFFLIGLLSLLNTPIGEQKPPEKAAGIAQTVIDMAYHTFSESQKPKLYQKNSDPTNADLVLLDEAIEKVGIHVDRYTSWHAIRDAFFDRGMLKEAGVAHRQAMPLLKEVAAFVNTDAVRDIYGEEACHEFWRNCMEAESLYPILTVPTRFTLGDAQIVALDIDEVAPKGSALADRQTAVMYMVASDVLTSRFFVMPADVQAMPERYQQYHRDRIDRIRQDPKRFVADEFHRVGKNSSVAEKVVRDLETASREARKWNLSIGLYSQDPGDFPEVLAGFATTVFIFGTGSRSVAEKAAQIFGLSENDVNICVKRLRKPGRAGATVLAKFATDEGTMTQFLVNTLGSRILWALATTTEDSYVRNKLYRILGDVRARELLARLYPGGSIKDLFEKLRVMQINQFPLPEAYEKAAQQLASKVNVDENVDARDIIVQHVINVHEDDMRRTASTASRH
jgi:intracellular multiplication protein IcmB